MSEKRDAVIVPVDGAEPAKDPFVKISRNLLRNAGRLGLLPQELALIVLVESWRMPGRDPYPGVDLIAESLGVSVRTVVGWRSSLVDKGYLELRRRTLPPGSGRGLVPSAWDFTGLWKALKYLETQPQKPANLELPFPENNTPMPARTTRPTGKIVPTNRQNRADQQAKLSRPTGKIVLTNRQNCVDQQAKLSRPTGNWFPPSKNKRDRSREVDQESKIHLARSTRMDPSNPIPENEEFGRDENFASTSALTTVEVVKGEQEVDVNEKQERAKAAIAAAMAKHRAAAEAHRVRRAEKQKRLENLGGKPMKPKFGPIIGRLEALWRAERGKAFPDLVTPKWDPKAVGQVKRLVEMYGEDLVAQAFRYGIRNWTKLRDRMFKGVGISPGLGFFVKVHEQVFAEAQVWAKYAGALEARDRYLADHPEEFEVPADLAEKAEAAEKALKAIGLG